MPPPMQALASASAGPRSNGSKQPNPTANSMRHPMPRGRGRAMTRPSWASLEVFLCNHDAYHKILGKSILFELGFDVKAKCSFHFSPRRLQCFTPFHAKCRPLPHYLENIPLQRWQNKSEKRNCVPWLPMETMVLVLKLRQHRLS